VRSANAAPGAASRASTSLRPASSTGAVTVVSGGWQKSEPKMSSNPTTLTSSGTRIPRRSSRRSTPIARRSLNATSAVASGSPAAAASAAAVPPSRVGANGPRLRSVMPAARACCDGAVPDAVGPRVGGPGEVGECAVPERAEVVDDLAGGVAGVGDDAAQARQLAVVEHDRPAPAELAQRLVRAAR